VAARAAAREPERPAPVLGRPALAALVLVLEAARAPDPPGEVAVIWAQVPMAGWFAIAAFLFAGVLGLRTAWRRLRDRLLFSLVLLGVLLLYAGVGWAAWVAGALWLSCLIGSVLPVLALTAMIRWGASWRSARAPLKEPWTAGEQAWLDGGQERPW
jgi:hypothetical protein